MRKITKFILLAQKSVKRFPVCFAFLAVLTFQLIYFAIIHESPNALTFFLSVGIPVGLLMHLIAEDKEEMSFLHIPDNIKTALTWSIPYFLLGLDSYYLHLVENVSNEISIAQSAAILALFIAICFLPFRKEKDDCKSWIFVLKLCISGCIAIAVALVMFGGLSLLYYGSSVLFDFHANDKLYIILLDLCMVTLPSTIFLIRVPNVKDMHIRCVPENSFLRNITRFLFMPLVLLYVGVLYVYGLQIVVTLTLPKGMLSTLVSTMMFGLMLLIFLFYPYLSNKNYKGYEVNLLHKLPLIVFPLIVLMSVGIGRRLYDYGITTNRLYLLTLNVWFYIVALGLWFNKLKRIHWVSISFSALLVLTSCHPWNYNSIYRNILVKRISQFTEKYDIKLRDIDEYELKAQLKKIPKEDAKAFYTALTDMESFDWSYFHKNYSNQLTLYRDYELFIGVNKRNAKSYSMKYEYKSNEINIPEGFKHVKYVSINYNELTTGNTPSHGWEVDYGTSCNDSTFIFHSSQTGNITITHRGLDNKKAVILTTADGKARFQLTELHILDEGKSHEGMRFTVEGYCFYN